MLILSKIVLLAAVIAQVLAETCLKYGEQATCVSLTSCPTILKTLLETPSKAKELLENVTCGGTPADPMVCCRASNVPVTSQTKSKQGNVFPDRRFCGYQHSDDYFHPGNATGLDEFPWLAYLIYKDRNNNTTSDVICAGSLITNRYVLTAAQCINISTTKYTLGGVRLGEHNVENTSDCTEDTGVKHLSECSDPVETFNVESVTVHPEYRPNPAVNDIALIRLDRKVWYSDYIRPICLPFPETQLAEPGDTLTMSGWGRNSDRVKAKIKKRILTKLITNQECEAEFQKRSQISITENYLCTLGLNTTDISCNGDGGTPVMYSVKNQWNQEGIHSFGSRKCNIGVPDVHTRVVNYLDWIKENVLP